ncbi:MAG: amidohydrolase [Pirellulaceae bacterium]|nr:amidohydrolase [Pirellulaceae bacterium]
MRKPNISRRDFAAMVSASAAITCTKDLSAADTPVGSGWIDAHVHVWTPDTKSYPLDKNFTIDSMKPASFTPEELFAHTKPAGVDRIVLIQMSFYNFDNSYMLDVMAKHPGVFGGVGIVDHRNPNVATEMRKLASAGVKGFRLHARGDAANSWPQDKGMATVWKTAQEGDLAVCPLINPSDLSSIQALCKQFPQTKVVIDHFARVGISGTVQQDQLDALCRLADFPHTHVKTSAFYALGKKSPPYTDLLPMIRRVLDAYGSQRLMWASDCPYQVQGKHSYEASIALIRDHADFLTQSDKENILRGTAERLFF